LLLSVDKTHAIAIEVSKSWQNLMMKRFTYSTDNRKLLQIVWKNACVIRPSRFDVVYAIKSDTTDWWLSRIVGMPDCGARYCQGIELWSAKEDIDIQAILDRSTTSSAILSTAQSRLPNQIGKKGSTQSIDYLSAIPSVMAGVT
jgi:hypothetical protein